MKFLVADDHPLVCDSLLRILQRLDPAARIVTAACRFEVDAALAHEAPDLALLDLNMPGMDGLCGLRGLLQRHPRLRIAVVSAQNDVQTVQAAHALGAAAFLPKSDPTERLVQALRQVLSGGRYFPLQARAVAPQFDEGALTPRQRDVLELMARGEPNKLIARQLEMAEGTVKIHVTAILRRLQARNRTEAVLIANQLGGA